MSPWTMPRRAAAGTLALAAVVPLAAGCSSSSSSSSAGSQLTVYAAASLQKTFTELGTQFQAAHPGTTVKFNFGGSSDLVSQLQQGAPADVFASADVANMNKAVAGHLVAGTPKNFATNSMEIATPPGNPAQVTSFASLANPKAKVVVCAPQVPCGAATVAIEHKTGVTLKPVSEESSVTDVLGKVTSGEADAGVVYVTDVKGAGPAVQGIVIPSQDNAVNTYPIGVLATSGNQSAAGQFEDFVLSPQGQQVLANAGFGAPT
jgi:molybdate transport system substrate-binding protein